MPASIPRLIITADDFGLTEGVNRGIVRAVTSGIVTSAAVMANGAAFESASRLAMQHDIDVGVHLTLVEERTLVAPASVPSLVDEGGRLPGRFTDLLRKLVLGRVDLQHVRAELRAQIERCLGAGLRPSHLSSHQHVHMWPALLDVTIALAREYDIPAIRCPRLRLPLERRSAHGAASTTRLGMAAVLDLLARRAARRIAAAGLRTTDHFTGMLVSGSLEERGLAVLLAGLSPGLTELVVHPAEDDEATRSAYGRWQFHWQQELAALTSEAALAAARSGSFRLVSFGSEMRAPHAPIGSP
ncbi:MAG: carbohydrate deacetylase [Gemmatimonadales bacterium]